MDIFGIVVSFSLVTLGIVTKNYWWSLFTSLIVLLFYPQVETVFWLAGAFIVGYVWEFASRDFSANTYLITVLLIAATILAFSLGETLIGIFLLLAMLLLFAFGTIFRVGRKTVKKVREEAKQVQDEVAKGKGQYPAGTKELSGMASALGTKTGEALNENPNYRFASPKLGERIAQGAQNLLDAIGRLLK